MDERNDLKNDAKCGQNADQLECAPQLNLGLALIVDFAFLNLHPAQPVVGSKPLLTGLNLVFEFFEVVSSGGVVVSNHCRHEKRCGRNQHERKDR